MSTPIAAVAGALGARRDVPQHRELRAAAAARLGCAPGRARRLAHGPDELGAVGRRDRGCAGVVRAARRGRRRRPWPSARPSRGSSASSPRRCRRARASSRRTWSSPRRSFPFLVQAHRGVTVRTVPAAELAGAIDASTDVVAFSAVQMATGEVADLAAIAAAAKAHGALTLVDATQACGWLPLDGYGFDVLVVGGLQVAALAARHRVHGGRAGAARRGRPYRRRLVRRRGRARDVLRRAAAARSRRPPARHLARLAQLGRRRTRARAARGDRRRARSTRTTSSWRTASERASGSSRATRQSCSSTCPRPRRGSSGRGSGRPCAAAGCARRGTSTTPARTSTGRSRRWTRGSAFQGPTRLLRACGPRRAARPSGGA